MTNKQAIQILKNMISNQRIMTAEMYEAFDMAIEALQVRASRNYEPILTEAERSEVLNAIVDALPSYQVDGYADNNGMFFDVFISKVERGEAE